MKDTFDSKRVIVDYYDGIKLSFKIMAIRIANSETLINEINVLIIQIKLEEKSFFLNNFISVFLHF